MLTLTIIVEPDRQRLARFAMDAVEALGGNVFASANMLESMLRLLRDDCAKAKTPVEVNLHIIEELSLCLAWGERHEVLATLTKPPSADTIKALTMRLKNASESADSTLLKRRNEQIIADLESAKQRARIEMEELETLLEMKKNELNKSILAAQTDALTGLYNRSGYDTRLREAFLRCKHQGEPLSLMLLDLDFFKQVNDTHGHQYGDEYLKKMAKALRASVREHVDHPCRMGGDEFAIILYSDLVVAQRAASKILNLMECKVSIGIAQLQENESIESLVGRADTVLYEAKHLGRGRFVSDELKESRVKVV
ncbi:MAG: GGDEF domain-containing protein [Sulfuricaulis sp.]|uniref:GGDEF domain-containing protein n=1 Tax=Sulfuricaulis sp. TaxID=2003553 RepID=UPI0025F3CD0E|nr:GGDEF domain-containing protein [Sulfuricaulis sp.]MCR4346868.1 GGDEF domain-containing protein [Sulfuricaulis sp.]